MASILVTGHIARGAVSALLAENRGELMRRFPSFFAPARGCPGEAAARMREFPPAAEEGLRVADAKSLPAAEEGQRVADVNSSPAAEQGLRVADVKSSPVAEQGLCVMDAEFPPAAKLEAEMDAAERIAVSCGVMVFRMQEGGILRALWELGEACNSGLSVDIKKIPIRQETIEICEAYDMDVFDADSRGALLLVAGNGASCGGAPFHGISSAGMSLDDASLHGGPPGRTSLGNAWLDGASAACMPPDGASLAWELARNGIDAAVIGVLTRGRARTLQNGTHIRYLDKPRKYLPPHLTQGSM